MAPVEANFNGTVAPAREAVIEAGITIEGVNHANEGTWMITEQG